MTELETLAALAIGALTIGGSIYFGLRVSRSSMTAVHDRVAAVNATLGELAQRLALQSVVAAPYRHPMVGEVPAFAVVAGERGGFAVRVEYVSDEDSGNFVITGTPRGDERWIEIGRMKAKRDGERHPVLAPAIAAIGDAAQEIRVEARTLRIVVRRGDATAAELHVLVDAALGLARALPSAP